jgi:hypothetical protein
MAPWADRHYHVDKSPDNAESSQGEGDLIIYINRLSHFIKTSKDMIDKNRLLLTRELRACPGLNIFLSDLGPSLVLTRSNLILA